MGFIVKKRSLSSNILMLIIILHRNSNYLGAGNHLVIHDSIREEFMEKAKDCQHLYLSWQRIVEGILKNRNVR